MGPSWRTCDQATCGGARGRAATGTGLPCGALMKKNRKRDVPGSAAGGTLEGAAGKATGWALGTQYGHSACMRAPSCGTGCSEPRPAACTGVFVMPRLVQISSQGELPPDQAASARVATGASTLATIASIAIQLAARRRRWEVMIEG